MTKNIYPANINAFTTVFFDIQLDVPLEFKTEYFKSNENNNEYLDECQPVIFTFETNNLTIFNSTNNNIFPNCIFWNEVNILFIYVLCYKTRMIHHLCVCVCVCCLLFCFMCLL